MVEVASGQILAGKTSEAAQTIQKWLTESAGQLGNKLERAATAAVVASRLAGFLKVVNWYTDLPMDTSYKYRLYNVLPKSIVSQFLSESMDLLLLKEQPMARLEASMAYLLTLKGYHDGPVDAPKSLTRMIKEGLEVLASAQTSQLPVQIKANAALDKNDLAPQTRSFGSRGLSCRQVLK
jgi:hypothetical protein